MPGERSKCVSERYVETGQRRRRGPFRPSEAGTESSHLRCRDGSKGLLTQLSPSLLASGSILCRREVISFQTEPYAMPQQRIKLTIAYRGSKYHGWQWQAANEFYKGPTPAEGEGIPTIQETVERAVKEVVRHPVRLVGSSRTDSRVQGKWPAAHFD